MKKNPLNLHAFLCALILSSSCITACQSRSENYKSQKQSSIAALANESESEKSSYNSSNKWYLVTKVSDGDTFWCMDEQQNKVKIRLIGIDSPEPRNYFRKKKQPFGKEASLYAKNLLLEKMVRLEFDVDSLDQFDRTLAYAYLEDGTFVNKKIVEDGYAVIMTIVPNIKYEQLFLKAQHQARESALGLWGETIKE